MTKKKSPSEKVEPKTTTNFDLDDDSFYGPDSFGGEDYPATTDKWYNKPLITPEVEKTIQELYQNNPVLRGEHPEKTRDRNNGYLSGSNHYNHNVPWIQTYSGRAFNPTEPLEDSIVIQDIAHSLSMQCRFSGHVKVFYSVAQHCVLVSYLCAPEDALWGLLHDASEAYLVDIPSPLKRSGLFDNYIELEKNVMNKISDRFGLSREEPASVKVADKVLLSMEARDLMSPLHPDWNNPVEPLPLHILPVPPEEAKEMFMKRFYELTKNPNGYLLYSQTRGAV